MELFKPEYAGNYYSQILSQCENAIEAMKKLQDIFNPQHSKEKFVGNTEVFMLASSFVASVTNIDKVFNNNSNQFARERSNYLKSTFEGIFSKLPSRTIRNSIEHFDERIDNHVVQTTSFIDQNVVMVPNDVKEAEKVFSIPGVPIFRHLVYVSSTKEFYLQLLGEEMNLTEVDSIVREIKMKCEELI